MFLLNLLLALVWVALSGQLTPLNFIIGLLLGYGLLALGQRAAGRSDYFKKVGRVLGLAGYFIWQLIVANLRVTYDILSPRHRMRPAVVAIPLDVQSSAEISLLANLITLTPGTLSLDVSPNRRMLYVHTMHVADAAQFKQEIKDGFERRVREVLQ